MDNIVEASFASSSVLRCSAPAQSIPGAVDVSVSIDGGASFGQASNAAVGHFRYLTPPVVTGLSPHSGPDTGGTVITVLGTGFNTEFRFVCIFRGRNKTEEASNTGATEISAVVLSTSELTCIAPPVTSAVELGREMEVVVAVDFGDGILTLLPTASGDSRVPTTFTYVPSAQLTVLNPDRGPAAGGSAVDIGGANFLPLGAELVDTDTTGVSAADTVWCRFGSTVTVGSRLSDVLIRCSSPPKGVGGPDDVEVSISINSGADFSRAPLGSELVRVYLP